MAAAGDAVQGLNDSAAFKASAKAAPVWTMRAKLPSSNDVQNRLRTEPAARGDLKRELEASKLPTQPCYSMGTREAGLMPPPKQPGPGQYSIPSTLEKSHPTEVMSGRGFSWGTTGRGNQWPSRTSPSPQQYRVSSEPALKKAPEWSIQARAKEPNSSEKEKRPDCQKYKVDKLTRDGPLFSPSWTLGPRRSQISQARSTWPGPDKFKPATEANGRRDRPAEWSFYHTDRFPPDKKREPPY